MMVFVPAALASMNSDIVVVIFTYASTSLMHVFMLVRNDEAAEQSGERLTKIDPVGPDNSLMHFIVLFVVIAS